MPVDDWAFAIIAIVYIANCSLKKIALYVHFC